MPRPEREMILRKHLRTTNEMKKKLITALFVALILVLIYLLLDFFRYQQYRNRIFGIGETLKYNSYILNYYYVKNEFPSSIVELLTYLDNSELNISKVRLINTDNRITIYDIGFDKIDDRGNILISSDQINFGNYLFGRKKGDIILFQNEYDEDYIFQSLHSSGFRVFINKKPSMDKSIFECLMKAFHEGKKSYFSEKFNIDISIDSIFLRPTSKQLVLKISNSDISFIGQKDDDAILIESFGDVFNNCFTEEFILLLPISVPINREDFNVVTPHPHSSSSVTRMEVE